MDENDIARVVFKNGLKVHRELGPGLLESVYEECLAYELRKEGVTVKTQIEIPVVYDGIRMNTAFRADMIVDDKVLIELKSVKGVESIHLAQTITYLKLTNLKLGLLINFNVTLFKDGVQRLANGL